MPWRADFKRGRREYIATGDVCLCCGAREVDAFKRRSNSPGTAFEARFCSPPRAAGRPRQAPRQRPGAANRRKALYFNHIDPLKTGKTRFSFFLFS